MSTDRPIHANLDVSVVLPTYNRSAHLRRTLDSVLGQRTDHRRYEVIVVDNNSTDDTRTEVERAAGRGIDVRYVLERNQGVSYARNAGIAVARAALLAFVDDDVCVDAAWIETICRTFEQHPEVDCIGGKVLPAWEATPPAWLTCDHWAPPALLDLGETSRRINAENPLCLLTANLACRREVFKQVGLFGTELQRVHDGIGSMEDHEWLMRFWAAGREAMYVPELNAITDVPLRRMTRRYHRRWHSGHGHYFALVRDRVFEASKAGRLFDVPAHAYRTAMSDAVSWLGRLLRGDTAGAFLFETRLRFFGGYFRTRVKEFFRRLRPVEQPVAVMPDDSGRPAGNTRVAPF
jgi:glycosyltransferase involved in cell wall biosynthesis